jgi:plasmid stability protein
MQYTIRRIPRAVDAALRRRARTRGKSLNEAAIEALSQGLGVDGRPVVRRDLGDIVNTWRKESAVEAALAAQDRVDEELWK